MLALGIKSFANNCLKLYPQLNRWIINQGHRDLTRRLKKELASGVLTQYEYDGLMKGANNIKHAHLTPSATDQSFKRRLNMENIFLNPPFMKALSESSDINTIKDFFTSLKKGSLSDSLKGEIEHYLTHPLSNMTPNEVAFWLKLASYYVHSRSDTEFKEKVFFNCFCYLNYGYGSKSDPKFAVSQSQLRDVIFFVDRHYGFCKEVRQWKYFLAQP